MTSSDLVIELAKYNIAPEEIRMNYEGAEVTFKFK